MVGFVSSPRFVEHETGPYHPERPDRIRAIHRAVRQAGLIDSPDPFPQFKLDLGLKPQRNVKLLELEPYAPDPQVLRLVHTDELIRFVQHMCRVSGVLDQGDTPVTPVSYEIALLSVGSALRAADAVMKDQARRAFSAARPPGHHAEPDRSMGFCLFNNIAIAARYVQRTYGVEKIAIVDFDVHHGNGTQAAFEDDPSVLFISLHQDPRTCYPGSGHEWEIGTGRGRGFTVNIPFSPGSDDDDYLKVIDARVVPEIDEFRPQLLMISAGFDAHREDPLANIALSDEGFELMTRALVAAADHHCRGRVVSILEGGYNLHALGRSVVRHLIAMT
ncbi:histone deacetylase family protein [Fontivita pretiosa]|uniref:histone deacetylase family protein n=1 Tax=Fontivita pretiosa TaxID=2989684 RepID=UPI003D17D9A0